MTTTIDIKIQEAQAELEKLQIEHQKLQEAAVQLNQRIQQVQIAGDATATRINTLTEIKALGAESFRDLDDTAVSPEQEAEDVPADASAEAK